MTKAFLCEICEDRTGLWRIDRVGDAVVTWSCWLHLSEVVENLQRQNEETRVVVYKARAR